MRAAATPSTSNSLLAQPHSEPASLLTRRTTNCRRPGPARCLPRCSPRSTVRSTRSAKPRRPCFAEARFAVRPSSRILRRRAPGLEPNQTLDALDELLARDLVRRTQVPRLFAFRHPIVRRAVYEGAPTGWRLAAHERADAALASRGATALQRARHVECWAPPGNAEAIAVLTSAGHSAAPRAPAAAAHWFGAALRLIGEDDAMAQLGVLVPSAMALGFRRSLRGGADGAATAACGTARRSTGPASPRRRRLLPDRARPRAPRRGTSPLDRGARGAPDRSSPEATALKLELSADAFFSGRFDEMRPWLEEALADAERALTAPPRPRPPA